TEAVVSAVNAKPAVVAATQTHDIASMSMQEIQKLSSEVKSLNMTAIMSRAANLASEPSVAEPAQANKTDVANMSVEQIQALTSEKKAKNTQKLVATTTAIPSDAEIEAQVNAMIAGLKDFGKDDGKQPLKITREAPATEQPEKIKVIISPIETPARSAAEASVSRSRA
ncbi:MAG: hypothetical protein WCL30_05950, partial [Pseudomonadota bacterium]